MEGTHTIFHQNASSQSIRQGQSIQCFKVSELKLWTAASYIFSHCTVRLTWRRLGWHVANLSSTFEVAVHVSLLEYVYKCQTETDLRDIWSPEPDCLRQSENSDLTCPSYLLWLELGVKPGKFQIYHPKLNCLYDILSRKQDSLIYAFFWGSKKIFYQGGLGFKRKENLWKMWK